MADNSRFTAYLLLKKKLSYQEKGIEYNKPLSIDIARVVYQNQPAKYFEIIGNFFKKLDIAPARSAYRDSIIVSNSDERSDYRELLDIITGDLDNLVELPIKKLPKKITVKIPNIIKALMVVFPRIKNTGYTFKEKLYLASRMTYYRETFRQINTALPGNKPDGFKCLTFNSSFAVETLLMQIMNNRNVDTYSLSHGISYVNYRQEIPLDRLNGENLTSKYVIVWGESSKNDLVNNFGVSEERILIGGNPKYKYRSINLKTTFKSCIVLLGRRIYDRGNSHILEIIKSLKKEAGINFYIRLHPSLSNERYKSLSEQYGFELLDNAEKLTSVLASEKYDFAIVNNSTAYFESLYYDIPCFRYAPDENEMFPGLDDKFYDAESLRRKIFSFKTMKVEEINREATALLVSVLGMGINRYKEILLQQQQVNEFV